MFWFLADFLKPSGCAGMKADSGIDMAKKEEYMTDETFEQVGMDVVQPVVPCCSKYLACLMEMTYSPLECQVFGYSRDHFKKLPAWKRIAAKKDKGIF